MKYLIIALSFVALPVFAAESVSITNVEVNRAAMTATVSGTSVYDASTETSGQFDSMTSQTNANTSWSFTSPRLNAGNHSFTASVGTETASRSFNVPSNDQGGLICPSTQPDCGMPQDFGKLMASQKPVQAIEKPVGAMTIVEIQTKLDSLIRQLIPLLIQRVAELQAQLANL